MPAGSKTDPPLAKADGDGGTASGVTELRRGKNHQEQLQPARGVRRCERNNSADTKVSEEGGAGGAPGTGAEIPLQPLEKTMARQAVPLQLSPLPKPCHANPIHMYIQPKELKDGEGWMQKYHTISAQPGINMVLFADEPSKESNLFLVM
ncbi:E3 ubiquitin-protein ligase MARCHF3 [Grus japonensis]|uniref:E3 ubiquitin-protein ligase MARCHF3 n=1 Tax=Grus japonensis TaxID=30415 RepID=A0ABC9W6V5_GRUJA